MREHDLTTEEIAIQLKVSKLTVYDLIKKGDLPSYRVGRQIRVKKEALEAYKIQSQNQHQGNTSLSEANPKSTPSQLIISGLDNSLDILAKELSKAIPSLQFLRSYIGSLDGLISMYRDEVDIVSTHLFDAETGSYNLPYIHKILGSKSFVVIHLMKRKAGLLVAKNNPKNIVDWNTFQQSDITLANREVGSGARVLLDEQLRLLNISRETIAGYNNIFTSHIDVASAIANNKADVGIGTEQAAKMANIDFIEMIEESYDLVMLNTPQNKDVIKQVIDVLHDRAFIHMLQSLNYNTGQTGQILHEQ